MYNSLVLNVLNVLFFVLTLIANYIPWNGKSIGEISHKYPTLITPAGFAFAIWGLIYVTVIVFLIWQFLSSKNAKIARSSIGLWLIIASCFQACWVPAWLYEQILLSSILMFGIFLSLACLSVRMIHSSLLLRLPFTLWFGWITAATLISISLVFNYSFGIVFFNSFKWAVGVIIIATAGSVFYGALSGNIVYPAVLAWAEYGIYKADTNYIVACVAYWMMITILIWIGIQIIIQTCIEYILQKKNQQQQQQQQQDDDDNECKNDSEAMLLQKMNSFTTNNTVDSTLSIPQHLPHLQPFHIVDKKSSSKKNNH